jgi:hypothetical protein
MIWVLVSQAPDSTTAAGEVSCSPRCLLSTYLCHHAPPGHKVGLDLCAALSVRALFVHYRPQQAVEMGVLLLLMVSERLKPLLEICANRRWHVVVYARIIVAVFVVIVVGEVRDFARTLDAC